MIGVLAPAKINLFLRICGRNDAGYHHIDSLIAFTEFGDYLTIEPANEDVLVLTGDFANMVDIPKKNNLVIRALNAFRQRGGSIGPSRIILEKRIPVGAGLGGGSSDAAALLLAANAASRHPLKQRNVIEIGRELGADVPVCLSKGCQRVANTGEVLTPYELPEIGTVLLVNPGVNLSTKDVFTSFANTHDGNSGEYGSGYGGSLSMLNATGLVGLGNDLTETAASLVPRIRNCLDKLMTANGVIAAAMSGSGSSCFAFFEDSNMAKTAAQHMQDAGYWAEVTRIYQPKTQV